MGSPRAFLSVGHPRQVWLIAAAHAVNEFYSVALPPILPLLVADLDISYAQAGGLLTVFYVMYTVFQLPAGRLADRVGQKRLLSAGMVGLAVGILIAGLAGDYPTLVLAEVIAGIGGSTYHPAGMSLISDLESATTEGTAMGIHGLGGVTGTALAPALIGGLAVLYDWRVALTAGAAVGLVYAGAFALLFTRPDGATEGPPDGEVADGGATDGGAVADDAGEFRDAGQATGDEGKAPAGGAGVRRFLATLGRLLNVPVAWWVAGLFLANFLIAVEVGAIRTFAPAYLFERTGESTGLANAVYFAMLVGGGVSSLGAGYLADRVDRKRLGLLTMALSAVGLAATYAVPAHAALLVAWFFLLGLVVWAVFPAMNALTSAYSEREFSASLFGVTLTAGSLGGAAGPLVLGVAAEVLGMTVAFPLIAAVSLLGVVAFALLVRV